MGRDCAVGCVVSVYASACRGALAWPVVGRAVWRRSLLSSAAAARILQTSLRIWWTSWSVVGGGYASFGLRPARLRTLLMAWYPQVRNCCGLGGGVWSCDRARLDLCVAGGDGPNPGHGPRGWPAALDPVGQAEHGQSQVVAHLPRGDLGQGAGGGLVPWLEDAPEDPVLGGGVPYSPWWGGPWGEHGVCSFDEPLRAGGRSRSGYHLVMPALEDCNQDLRRGVVTVCRWGGRVVVWGAEAGGAEGGVAGWCGGLFPLLRAVRVCWVVRLRWGPSEAYGPLTRDVDAGVVRQGLAPLDGGDPDVLALGVFAGSPEYEVYDGLVEAAASGGQVPEGFDAEELGPVFL